MLNLTLIAQASPCHPRASFPADAATIRAPHRAARTRDGFKRQVITAMLAVLLLAAAPAVEATTAFSCETRMERIDFALYVRMDLPPPTHAQVSELRAQAERLYRKAEYSAAGELLDTALNLIEGLTVIEEVSWRPFEIGF